LVTEPIRRAIALTTPPPIGIPHTLNKSTIDNTSICEYNSRTRISIQAASGVGGKGVHEGGGHGRRQKPSCFLQIKYIKCVYRDKHISCRRVTEVLQNSATRLENKDLRRRAAATDAKTAEKTRNAARYATQGEKNGGGRRRYGVSGDVRPPIPGPSPARGEGGVGGTP
jgi:hypothetical protein